MIKGTLCGKWVAGLLGMAIILGWTGCSENRSNQVVVYAAQDQVYAEPIFESFTRETGIRVLPLFDSEAVKTVGLANRLLAEKSHPQCDVFWGNEEMRARQLGGAGYIPGDQRSGRFWSSHAAFGNQHQQTHSG